MRLKYAKSITYYTAGTWVELFIPKLKNANITSLHTNKIENLSVNTPLMFNFSNRGIVPIRHCIRFRRTTVTIHRNKSK